MNMHTETLKRAIAITERIEVCKANIKMAEYTQADQVVAREMESHFIGAQGKAMTIPPALWRVVGKLVLAEYQQELNALEKEFESL